mmetsp:Transcript_13594/g.29940  ORF Transcript_13594/g.29940 Transcript_13594/m.29940 type:complete len:153 (-) Transcript_13594:84-542(-)
MTGHGALEQACRLAWAMDPSGRPCNDAPWLHPRSDPELICRVLQAGRRMVQDTELDEIEAELRRDLHGRGAGSLSWDELRRHWEGRLKHVLPELPVREEEAMSARVQGASFRPSDERSRALAKAKDQPVKELAQDLVANCVARGVHQALGPA